MGKWYNNRDIHRKIFYEGFLKQSVTLGRVLLLGEIYEVNVEQRNINGRNYLSKEK